MWLRSGQHPFTEHLLCARPCAKCLIKAFQHKRLSKHESSREITKMEYAPQASFILSTWLPSKAAGYEHTDITQTCLLFFPVVSVVPNSITVCGAHKYHQEYTNPHMLLVQQSKEFSGGTVTTCSFCLKC